MKTMRVKCASCSLVWDKFVSDDSDKETYQRTTSRSECPSCGSNAFDEYNNPPQPQQYSHRCYKCGHYWNDTEVKSKCPQCKDEIFHDALAEQPQQEKEHQVKQNMPLINCKCPECGKDIPYPRVDGIRKQAQLEVLEKVYDFINRDAHNLNYLLSNREMYIRDFILQLKAQIMKEIEK